jgi:hypothetical protein
MKKLLVILVLMIVAVPSFAKGTKRGLLDVPFMHGFIGRSKDLQDCRTVIQGDVSPLEMAQLMATTRNPINTDTENTFDNLFK